MARKPKDEEIEEYDNEDILVDGKFYQGNENILRKDATFKWTEEMLAEVKLCAKSVLHFAEKHFYIVTEDGKKKIELYKYQKKLLKAFKSNRFNVVLSSRQSGKALDLNTPISTPKGFVKMGDLKDGDKIHGIDGKIYNVTKAHDVLYDRECFKVIFDNGEEIIADSEHLWSVTDKNDRKKIYYHIKNKKIKDIKNYYINDIQKFSKILNTETIFNNMKNGFKYCVPVCNKIEYNNNINHKIPPYIMGYLLGDGDTNGRGRVSCTPIDKNHIINNFKKLGYKINKNMKNNECHFNILNLKNNWEYFNLHEGKYIHDSYVFSSYNDRLELIKGLIDSDGHVDNHGCYRFSNINEKIVKTMKIIVSSLGLKCKIFARKPRIRKNNITNKSYDLIIHSNIPLSTLERKNVKARFKWKLEQNSHYIKDIQKIESVPVRCITVDSPDSLYLCGNTYIPTHNTTTITIYALWLVCFQSDKRVTIVANKESTAKEIFARIKMAYEQLPVFLKPHIKSWRKDGLNLGNDSSITISTTSSSGPRGTTSNLLIIDEMAHCPDDLMKELWKSALPIISSMKKSQVVVISTPNGVGNKFHELYEESRTENSEWNLEVVNWWDVPGRDEAWKEKEIRRMGSKEDFDQEYACVFHEPGKTVVDSEYLKELFLNCIDPILVNDDGAYRVYKMPNPQSFYVVGVDVGEGIGRSNTVAQILDVSNLQNIEQVAVFASNSINPYHFGTRLLGILNDWGRPPILIENNNNGLEVLNVLARTHNYENIVTYSFEGMSKHYNNESRLGIHNHTNTKYKGITNFRYWVDSLKAVKFYDKESVLEIGNFIRLPNFTFTKKSEKELDDRVFGLIWALFILDPSLVGKYFIINELDEQGRPTKILPFSDNTDLIKGSPLLIGGGASTIAKRTTGVVPYTHIGGHDEAQGFDMYSEDREILRSWLLSMEPDRMKPPIDHDNTGKSSMDTFYNPTILF